MVCTILSFQRTSPSLILFSTPTTFTSSREKKGNFTNLIHDSDSEQRKLFSNKNHFIAEYYMNNLIWHQFRLLNEYTACSQQFSSFSAARHFSSFFYLLLGILFGRYTLYFIAFAIIHFYCVESAQRKIGLLKMPLSPLWTFPNNIIQIIKKSHRAIVKWTWNKFNRAKIWKPRRKKRKRTFNEFNEIYGFLRYHQRTLNLKEILPAGMRLSKIEEFCVGTRRL